ncbi:MAG: hypothetical protein AAB569_00335 [Patescibacteria group bacterium]
MPIDTVNIIISIASALLGALISWIISIISEKYRFRQELKSNNNIDISGDDWHGAWQTSVNQSELINTERLSLKQKGNTIKIKNLEKSPENPEGGYLWEGQLKFFFGRDLMGWYNAIKAENNTSKGIMFFCYDSPKRLFIGKWVGSAYDGPLNTGFGVISKDPKKSKEVLSDLLSKHKHDVILIQQKV